MQTRKVTLQRSLNLLRVQLLGNMDLVATPFVAVHCVGHLALLSDDLALRSWNTGCAGALDDSSTLEI